MSGICVEVCDGFNSHYSITYPDGTVAKGRSDYMTYTCLDNKGNVRVCQWNIVRCENIDSHYEKQFSIDSKLTKKTLAHNVIVNSIEPRMPSVPTEPQQPTNNSGNNGNHNGANRGNGRNK